MADTPTLEVDINPSLEEEEGAYESSSYGSYQQSAMSTGAFSGSFNEYLWENGRQYNPRGIDKNPLPVDETEQKRLDIHHEIMTELLGGELYKAPLKNPRHILDVGTGTGIWAMEIADTFPEAEVIGFDLSPIQPSQTPPNCRFEVDDAEKDWMYRPDSFDFVHLRNLAQAITDWPKVISQAYRVTKPGGYVELAENGGMIYCDDGTMSHDNPAKLFYETLRDAMEKTGRPSHILGSTLSEYLENSGFVDVQVTKVKMPFGSWPKEPRLKKIGRMAVLGCLTGFNAYGLAVFTRVLGMNKEQAERQCQEAFSAITDRNTHMYSYYYVAHGRKPGRVDEA
ncbi:putative TAM domain methyltransferase [Trichophaea hybrida]|nr:putative TAM domain methyltransferase [Trichophaea hybrida]